MQLNTIKTKDFWKLFDHELNKLVKNYNFTNNNNTCYDISITNLKYSIDVYSSTHPQFDEVELEIWIKDINSNVQIYNNKYLLINNHDRTTITLEEPAETFIKNFFDEIIKIIR